MFSLFCTVLGSSATRSSEYFLQPLAKLLCSFPFRLLTFCFCRECKLRAALFPCDCEASPHVDQVQEPFCSHEKILSLSSIHSFNVWRALFSAEFLPCTALFVPLERWPFSAQGLSLTWHSTLVLYFSVHWRQLHGSRKFTGMQIYYLLFSNSVGHMFILYAWVLFLNNIVYTIDRFKVD